MNIVFDTCALLWYTLDPSELSPKAHAAIKNSKRILISSISIWEVAIKCLRNKLSLGVNIQEYVKRCELSADFEILPVSHQDWLNCALLEWDHRDPADRLIVTLAIREGAVLLTDDTVMKKYYKKCVS